MSILRYSFMSISKFKVNHITSCCGKFSFFQSKSSVLHNTYSPLILSAHRCLSIRNPYKVNSISTNNGKMFKETENLYAHKIMENLSQYTSSLLKHPLSMDIYISDSQQPSDSNAIAEFVKVTVQNLFDGLTLENSKFTYLVERVCSALPGASDENIKEILHYLCMWPPSPSTMAPNFKILWNMLDRECVKRMNGWNVSQKLLIADYWFHLRLSRITQYNLALISNLIQNIDSLSNHQLTQLMFYINLQRRLPEVFLPNLERKLDSIVKFLTPEELSIVCLGFFKTQSKISSISLIQSIIKEFTKNVENLHTISAAAILKFLRKSMNNSLTDLYIPILDKCISRIDSFDVPTSVHLALLALQCNVYHPLLLNCVSEKLTREITNVRIKDCSKLLLYSSIYNHFEERFYDSFFAELKKEERQDEIISHPIHVLHLVLAYAYMGHYNYDLIAKTFSKEFIRKSTLLSPEIRSTYAELDCCIEIECPDYTGPRLDVSEKSILRSRRGNIPSKSQFHNMQTRLLSDVYESIVQILGNDKNVLVRHILPHMYSPDIIVRLSGNMDQSLFDVCREFSTDFILKPPSDENWAAFIICSTYSFAHRSSHMTGTIAMKLRQLKKIGYHATYIPYFNVSRKISQRNVFLKEKLNMLEQKLTSSCSLKN